MFNKNVKRQFCKLGVKCSQILINAQCLIFFNPLTTSKISDYDRDRILTFDMMSSKKCLGKRL